MAPLTHRARNSAKRLTEGEKLLIHTERNMPKANRKTVRQTASEYGVSVSTVSDLEHSERLKDKLAKAEHIKKALSANLYITAQASLDAITNDRLLKVNAYQNAIITATCLDKARLIEGSSTSNIDLRLSSDQLARMMEAAQATVIDVTPEVG